MYNIKMFVTVIVIFVISIVFKVSWIGILCAFPYLLSYFFFAKRQVSNTFSGLGDLSYPLYLCAFPIQQLVIHISGGNMNPYLNILYSLLLALLCSIVFSVFEKNIIMKKR